MREILNFFLNNYMWDLNRILFILIFESTFLFCKFKLFF